MKIGWWVVAVFAGCNSGEIVSHPSTCSDACLAPQPAPPPPPPSAPPTLAGLVDITTDEDTPSAPVGFTVGDPDTALGDVVVIASSDAALVPLAGIALEGEGSARTLSIVPAPDASGTATLTLTASDGSAQVSATIEVTVNPVDDAPVISDVGNQGLPEDGASAEIPFFVSDVESDAGTLVVSASSSNQALLPLTGITLGGEAGTRTVRLVPAADQTGTSTVTLTVSDGTTTASDSFVLSVGSSDDPPALSDIPAQTTAEDGTLVVTFTVSDPDTPLAALGLQAASNHPALVQSMSFSGTGTTRTLTVVPRADAYGVATIVVTLSDATSSAMESFAWTVTPVVDPWSRTFSPPTTTYVEGAALVGNTLRILGGDRVAQVPATVWNVERFDGLHGGAVRFLGERASWLDAVDLTSDPGSADGVAVLVREPDTAATGLLFLDGQNGIVQATRYATSGREAYATALARHPNGLAILEQVREARSGENAWATRLFLTDPRGAIRAVATWGWNDASGRCDASFLGADWNAGHALAVNAAGETLVAGYADPRFRQRLILTLVDAGGRILWMRDTNLTYAWPSGATATGNEFAVTGMMTDPAGDYSGFLVRVSRDGGVRWARRLGPAQAGLNEAGTGLFSDASEDLTVAGWFMPAEGAQADLFTLVVDRQGQLRARGWRMGGVGNDAGVFALASPDGGAYLFGHSRGSFGNGDYDVWAMATGGDLHVPLRPASGGTTSALDLAFGPLGFELFAVNPCVVTLAPALSSLAPRAESVTVTAAAQAP